MKRITFITTSFPRFPSDYAGVFVYDLARGLVQLGVNIHVVAPHTPGTERQELIDGIHVTRFPYFYPAKWQKVAYGAGIPTNLRRSWLSRLQIPFFLFGFLRQVIRVTKDSDLVHAHWVEPGLLAQLGRRLHPQPMVLSVHRYNPPGRMGKQLYDYVFGNADYVLFNSHFTEQRCRQENEIQAGGVIPPGIDLDKFQPKWTLSQDDLHANQEKMLVFGLGSLLPVKGWIHLVEALPLIRQQVDCQIVIGGQGPEYDRLLARAEQLQVRDNLTLLGRLDTAEVPSWMQRADVFVLPSIAHKSGDTEALGMVLVEAMACGTPCVASNVGGIADIVEDGVNGFLVESAQPEMLADKIVALLQNEPLRKQMGEAGRHKVEVLFSLNRVAERVLGIYEQLLQKDKG
ncbi:MAG: glycosyltransferase family 4 protein [Chloroflexi bacterium]|nr:glycosyltransferase family 4 protein [Chloroflexota bacterium]